MNFLKPSQIAATASLPVMEDFYTLQGEGFHQGKPAYFVRLGGCDVGCHWCDVKESWDASKFPLVTITEIIDKILITRAPIAVVTGGEPLMHNLEELTLQLKHHRIRCHIETSGVYPITGFWDWICLSPKKFKQPTAESLACASELKIIIYNKSDFGWAEELASVASPAAHLYLQPEWSKHQENSPMIVEYIKNNPKWRLSLQVHKYLDIP